MISLVSLSCVSANDFNGTDIELGLSEEDSQNLELAGDDAIINGSANVLSETPDNSNNSAYLILDNDADLENVYVGDYVVWTVSVINIGPDTAKNVKVFNQLPDGLKYVKHQLTKGTFDYKTGIWDIGDLSVNDGEVFLYITTLAMSVGEKINKANLTTDSINLNNETYEEEEIDVFERAKNNDIAKVDTLKTSYPTGNPLFLVFASILLILATSVKSKK